MGCGGWGCERWEGEGVEGEEVLPHYPVSNVGTFPPAVESECQCSMSEV